MVTTLERPRAAVTIDSKQREDLSAEGVVEGLVTSGRVPFIKPGQVSHAKRPEDRVIFIIPPVGAVAGRDSIEVDDSHMDFFFPDGNYIGSGAHHFVDGSSAESIVARIGEAKKTIGGIPAGSLPTS